MALATEFGPDSGGRIKVWILHLFTCKYDFLFITVVYNEQINTLQGLTIIKPIIYGNIARYFGKKREEDGHTHQWTVYVKPYLNEDMSAYVKKVNFKLHESYNNPSRVVTKPPFELTETGWGEFELAIKIYFHDPTERHVRILCFSWAINLRTYIFSFIKTIKLTLMIYNLEKKIENLYYPL